MVVTRCNQNSLESSKELGYHPSHTLYVSFVLPEKAVICSSFSVAGQKVLCLFFSYLLLHVRRTRSSFNFFFLVLVYGWDWIFGLCRLWNAVGPIRTIHLLMNSASSSCKAPPPAPLPCLVSVLEKPMQIIKFSFLTLSLHVCAQRRWQLMVVLAIYYGLLAVPIGQWLVLIFLAVVFFVIAAIITRHLRKERTLG